MLTFARYGVKIIGKITCKVIYRACLCVALASCGVLLGMRFALPQKTQAATSASDGFARADGYTVGGSVSGLSGVLVLQDNGGDRLTLASNGPFTIANEVATGAGYDVRVKTESAGQHCTVSGGSGKVASADVTDVAVSCTSATSASDDFARADGSLGPDWSDMSDGGLAISSGVAVGTSSGESGDVWEADSFGSNQYSQITVAAQLTGGEWIGAAVRAQDGGQDTYAGIYYWNYGSPELQLVLRTSAAGWAQLGSSYSTPPLPAGTKLELTVVANTLSFSENGRQVISVSDGTISGGAPGILASGSAEVGGWAGGDAGFQVKYADTASNGVKYFNVISANDGYGVQTLRVLQPTDPAPGIEHNFLIVLPVEAGLGSTYGDGLETLQAMDAEDAYNLTIVEPTFTMDPWYANNPEDPNIQYQTFLTRELVPWMRENLSTTGREQIWLLGFSKSGLGAQDLILKYPSIFSLAASWDFPADLSTYDFGDAVLCYGTQQNFQDNYELTPAFVRAHAASFKTSNRIWIGGYSLYETDISDYDKLLTAQGVEHTTEKPQPMPHTWDGGWVPIAMAALYQDSVTQTTSNK